MQKRSGNEDMSADERPGILPDAREKCQKFVPLSPKLVFVIGHVINLMKSLYIQSFKLLIVCFVFVPRA